MFARIALRKIAQSPAVKARVVVPTFTRSFGAAAVKPSGDVVVPELVDTLEWVLDSPPNVHQFDEPPIVVEIEHLENLIAGEH